MTAKAIPVIICGAHEAIGRVVVEGLKPEYEAIRFIMTPAAAVKEIPLLLTEQYHLLPPPQSTLLGTQNFSERARAVLFGGAYTDEDVSAIQAALREAGISTGGQGSGQKGGEQGRYRGVPLLRADMTRSSTPLGPEYAKEINGRVKKCLEGLRRGEEGGFDGDGVVWF